MVPDLGACWCNSLPPCYYGTGGAATQAAPSGNYWQNLYNPNGDYARCYWDTTHVLSAYAEYELPIGRGKQFGYDLPTAVNAGRRRLQ
jgi:hypothetical protein